MAYGAVSVAAPFKTKFMIPIAMAGDISKSFEKMVADMFIKVDGCLVEKTRDGFIIWGTEVKTLDEVRGIIADSRRTISNSIKNPG